MPTTRRAILLPADVARDTVETITLNYTYRGSGILSILTPDRRGSVTKRVTIKSEDSPKTSPTTRRVLLRPDAADVGTDLTIDLVAVPRTGGVAQAAIEADKIVSITGYNAMVPEIAIDGFDSVNPDGGTYTLTIRHVTPGLFDTIAYEWELDFTSVGSLVANDNTAQYTAPAAAHSSGAPYCVEITIRVMVTGTGTNAKAETEDMSETTFLLGLS